MPQQKIPRIITDRRQMPEQLDTAWLMRYTGLSKPTLLNLAKDGTIPGIKLGGQWRFNRDEVLAVLDEKQKRKEAIKRC